MTPANKGTIVVMLGDSGGDSDGVIKIKIQ